MMRSRFELTFSVILTTRPLALLFKSMKKVLRSAMIFSVHIISSSTAELWWGCSFTTPPLYTFYGLPSRNFVISKQVFSFFASFSLNFRSHFSSFAVFGNADYEGTQGKRIRKCVCLCTIYDLLITWALRRYVLDGRCTQKRERNNFICIAECAAFAVFVFGNRHVIKRLESFLCFSISSKCVAPRECIPVSHPLGHLHAMPAYCV